MHRGKARECRETEVCKHVWMARSGRGTWLGVLYRHFTNSKLSLEGGRGVPLLRWEDKFLVGMMGVEEVDM